MMEHVLKWILLSSACLMAAVNMARAEPPVIWAGTTAAWLPTALKSAGLCVNSASGVITSAPATLSNASHVTGVLPNANTTAASANTASAIVARDGSGNFSAGTISAALSGNASTASALAANPADCGGGQFANAIAANGDLTCATPAGAGDVVGPASATDNAVAVYDGTTGKLLKNSSVTISGSTVTASLSGNATTATALAADPANCSAGATAGGINASGTAEACLTPVTTLGAVGSSANANGATLSSNTLNLEPASASFPGVVTTGTQTIAGAKTFNTAPLAVTGLNATANLTITDGTNGAKIRFTGVGAIADVGFNASDEFQIGPTGAFTTLLRTSGATRMTVGSTGEIAIGASAPVSGQLLTVDGKVVVKPHGTSTGETGQVLFRELAANGTNSITVKAPDSTSDVSLTLPSALPSVSDTAMVGSTAGVLSFGVAKGTVVYYGQASLRETVGCLLTRTSASTGEFTADADCPGPTVDTQASTGGTIQTTDADLPRFTVDTLTAGVCDVSIDATIDGNGSTADLTLGINDGTSERGYQTVKSHASGEHRIHVSTIFSYASPATRSFNLIATSASGDIRLINDSNIRRTTFKISCVKAL